MREAVHPLCFAVLLILVQNADNHVLGNRIFLYGLVVATADIALPPNLYNPVEHKLPVFPAVKGNIVLFQWKCRFFNPDGILAVRQHGAHAYSVGYKARAAPVLELLLNQGIKLG